MVDKNDVYLNIKINYKNKIKEIKSTELLTINEIKSKILELFSLKNNSKKDLELYYAKDNKIIVNDDDIFDLMENVNDYLYVLEINLKNNKIDIKEQLQEEIAEIKKRKEKIKELKNEINKYKFLIQCNKKKKELKTKINTRKIINKIKAQLIEQILPEIIKDLRNNNNANKYFTNIDKEIKKKITENIYNQLDEFKVPLKKQVIKQKEKMQIYLDSIDKKIN